MTMKESITKTIVDNINNVLGSMPKPLNFEVPMPATAKPRKRRVKARPAVKAKRKVKAVGARAAKTAKRAKRSVSSRVGAAKAKKKTGARAKARKAA